MSPTPLIQLQRRLAEAGRIRMGEKTEKGAPKRLDTWRITSPTKALIEQAAGLYGGEPKPWESPIGKQWEVVTTTAELPVLVMPGYSFRQGYEHRTSPTLVERRCDGVEMDDGKPCVCNAEAFEGDECALITRLTVALPELTTMLGWRLETKGDNAARELLASMDLVQGVSGGRPFVPAKLRIVERRGNVNGQAVRYVVPVIDVQVRYAEVLGGQAATPSVALPSGYIPIERVSNAATLADGLREAETQTLTKPPRVPLPEDDDILNDSGPSSPPPPADAGSPKDGPEPSHDENIAALNALVGTMREAGTITTRQLWVKVARMRKTPVDEMVDLYDGFGTDGELHWSPLRQIIRPEEAVELRKALGALWAKMQDEVPA